MVDVKLSVLKVSPDTYLESTHVFPTPESPIKRSLKSRSYGFFGGTSPGGTSPGVLIFAKRVITGIR